MAVELVQGDITRLEVDAIVNAANSTLLGGGGVDGAIHRAAGPGLLAACRQLRATTYPAGLPTGEAVVTPGFDLPAKWVVHTVGPVYEEEPAAAELLRAAYLNSALAARQVGARSIAFPAISTGVYGYPKAEAAQIALAAAAEFVGEFERVVMCLFSAQDLALYEELRAAN